MSKNKRTRYVEHEEEDEAQGLPDDEDDAVAVDADPLPKRKKPSLQERLAGLNEEYRMLAGDSASAGRRAEVARELRAVRDAIHAQEGLLEVTVPPLPHGTQLRINDRTYPPGKHVVRESVASTLLWTIDQTIRQERRRLEGREYEMDATNPGARARAILADVDGGQR